MKPRTNRKAVPFRLANEASYSCLLLPDRKASVVSEAEPRTDTVKAEGCIDQEWQPGPLSFIH